MRASIAATAALAAALAAAPAFAQDGAGSADELLAEGWRLYSEDLEFERAAEAFAQAVDTAGATEAQQLEALEYLAACRYATEDHEGTRDAIRRLLLIDREGTLHDPAHPPDLLAMVDEIRAELPPEEPLPPEPTDVIEDPDEGEEPPPTFGSGGTDPDTTAMLEDQYPDRPERPWYTTWWFWTITGAVIVAGVTTAIVLSVPSGQAEPPSGNLDPGVVQLPCSAIRF